MKSSKDKSPKDSSFWGMFFSIALHAIVIGFVLFWGFRTATNLTGSEGPIQVSLSGIEEAGNNGSEARPQVVRPAPQPVKQEKKVEPPPPPEPEKKPEPEPEKKVEVKKEEPVKEEKKPEPPPEPEKKEPEKKIVEEKPEEEDVVPLETVKKEEVKKEEKKEPEKKKEQKVEKKEEKKVAEKPEPTKKPEKKTEKKTAKKDTEKEKDRILKDIERQKILNEIRNKDDKVEETPSQPVGQEQQLAMADNRDIVVNEPKGQGSSSQDPGGGSSVSPVIIQMYQDQIHRRISRSWTIPPGVPTDTGLITMVLFKIDQTGKVYDVRVQESSGSSSFDDYCVKAIYRAAPLPPPPPELAEVARTKGVVVPFKNQSY